MPFPVRKRGESVRRICSSQLRSPDQAVRPAWGGSGNPAPWRQQAGAGLIEMMVALLVLAIGLLGFAAMQTQGISQGQKAYLHSQAIFAAQDMVERMRANPDGLNSYTLGFSDSAPSKPSCDTADCTPANLARWDQAEWLDLLGTSLPAGDGAVAVNTSGASTEVLISVRYRVNRDLDTTDQTRNENMSVEEVYELRAEI